MNLAKLPIVKEDERGIIYDCGKVGYIFRKQGTVSANHVHEDAETLYLVEGRVELTIGDKTQVAEAPIKIEIPSNIYHKLVALTDIRIVEERDYFKKG